MMEVEDPAYTYADTVTCTSPLIAENEVGGQWAARGAFFWDATDPFAVGLHFEIMRNSLPIDPAQFTVPDGRQIRCLKCDEVIPFETMGALVVLPEEPTKGILWCLVCADDHPSTVMEESIWMLGLDQLEGVFADAPPADADAAAVRIWRLDEEAFQISLRDGRSLLTLTAIVERLELFFCAIREYEQKNKGNTEGYIDSELDALERLANGG